MLREIKASEAFKAHEKGQEIKVLAPSTEGGYDWINIDELITGCKFFTDEEEKLIQEPEPDNPEEPPEIFPNSVEEPLEAPPPESPPEKRKRKQIDVGKIMALHRAGWNNVKIADEMKLHPVTVGKYIRQEEDKDGSR